MDALATHQLQGRERGIEPIKVRTDAARQTQLQVERRESHRAIKVLRSPPTPATGGEERES